MLYNVDMLLRDVVELLEGGRLSVIRHSLHGLDGPGAQDLRNGDDVLMLGNMSFPLVGQLEPLPTLGNPKKGQCKILGNAVVRDINTKGETEHVWHNRFLPTKGNYILLRAASYPAITLQRSSDDPSRELRIVPPPTLWQLSAVDLSPIEPRALYPKQQTSGPRIFQ